MIDRDIIWEEDAKFPSFRLKELPQQDRSVVLDEKSEEKGSELRRRRARKAEYNPLGAGGEPDDTGGEEVEKETTPVVKQDPRDPIRWFGILVPQSLKDAQMRFSDGILHIPIQ